MSKVIFDYDNGTMDIQFDEMVIRKMQKRNQLNNFQTNLFLDKIEGIKSEFMYEMMNEALRTSIENKVNLICSMYLRDELDYNDGI